MTKDNSLFQEEGCCQLKARINILCFSTVESSNYKIRLEFGISVYNLYLCAWFIV